MDRQNEQLILATTEKNEPLISVIVPTRNELENIELLLERIEKETIDISIEVIFVDDLTDETPNVIRKLQNQFPFQIGLIARTPEQRLNGLGGEVIEGFRAARDR